MNDDLIKPASHFYTRGYRLISSIQSASIIRMQPSESINTTSTTTSALPPTGATPRTTSALTNPMYSTSYFPAGSLRPTRYAACTQQPTRLLRSRSPSPHPPASPDHRDTQPPQQQQSGNLGESLKSAFCLSCPPADLSFSAAYWLKNSGLSPTLDVAIGNETAGRDYIGFATLPEQVHRKSVKKGFEFTLMVVGESGLGKSTVINSIFLTDLYKDRKIPNAQERLEKTTVIEKKMMDIEEKGVKLRLTIVDTPGFGDGLNCDESWRSCAAYIDEQFRQYFQDESGLNRRNIQDNRVHCCLYFIPPYGHGLRQLDVEFLKRLHNKVNIVPVIAKADTLTSAEVKKLKDRIMEDILENGIQIYKFPECDSDEDDEFKQQDKELKSSVPFAIVGSNTIIEGEGGKRVRGRYYPWGVVEVENPKHCDFIKLRTMLISTHMQDLKDITQDVHYENFRAQCISQISQQALRERSKLKRDSVVGNNSDPVTETDRLLQQKDEEIRRMHDMLAQMQERLKANNKSKSIFDSQVVSGSKPDEVNGSNKRDSIVNV